MPRLYLVEQPQFPLISWIINNVASSVSPGEDDPALEPVSLLSRHSGLEWSVVDINNHCWQQHHLNQSAPVTDILHHHHWLSQPVSSGIIKDHVYRIWKVEGRCTQLTLSSLHTYIIIGWHKSIVSSDWSDTMVWFGQILLYFNYYHPLHMILGKYF